MPSDAVAGVAGHGKTQLTRPDRAPLGTTRAASPALVGLDGVLDLDVVPRAEPDAALEALADLGRVILEPAQRVDLQVVVDDHPAAQQPSLGVPPDLAGLRTMQPAMLPNLEERKISRTSAVPVCTSSNSGLSMPLSAASTSSMAW